MDKDVSLKTADDLMNNIITYNDTTTYHFKILETTERLLIWSYKNYFIGTCSVSHLIEDQIDHGADLNEYDNSILILIEDFRFM